ncbi:melanoma-associated antigen F1 [Tamandua tetradactyla]|uniref:melanoma-associated antigen F1 n=1 Tax=Tamandua tetradactyla TaxID=48850 RepID=UPI004053DFF6
MCSAQCVRNNKQPTKGLGRGFSNPNEQAASGGDAAAALLTARAAPHILITATPRPGRAGKGDGDRRAPSLRDGDGLLPCRLATGCSSSGLGVMLQTLLAGRGRRAAATEAARSQRRRSGSRWRCGRCSERSLVRPRSPRAAAVSWSSLHPATVQSFRCSSHPSRTVHALHLPAREHVTETRSRCLPVPQAEAEKAGGRDGEIPALTASRGEAPSPLLRDSPNEALGAVSGEAAAEPALIQRGAKALAGRGVCRRLHPTVTELVHFLLAKDRTKSAITRSEMVKCVVGDFKDLFPEIIARAAEHLRLWARAETA